MRNFVVVLVLGALAGLCLTSSASAAPCDSITEHGKAVQAEFQKWTEAAYSDGVITGQESEEAQAFGDEEAKITEELGFCINGDRPYTDGFELSGETFKAPVVSA